ncbi:lipocalin-like domain-containing protein [Imhoffiella purpurea]|uniref:AttH component of AttEFGH ABC transport system n=1 Tax=Imhoffiella purpurea TaxID=1249627 RepID=W9V5T4_9GAMM|nr:lipocalin-like domain-containing protein [Imhoffiella purpurea]EXJ14888.1 AttH component of AttEFGH ABC transport system [Imhoffiella purpurea]
MHRRTCLLALAGLPLTRLLAADEPAAESTAREVVFAPVLPGRTLVFPDDEGAHPEFRTEWWYVTGWLDLPDGRPLGFQVTFFRVRTGIGEDNPSAFAPRQLILAHAAIADPELGRLRHDQRAARSGFGRAGFSTGRAGVWLGDWSFEQIGDGYRARVDAEDFGYDLAFLPDGPPLLNGQEGFSLKAPGRDNASYYYSRPQLTVEGRLTLDGHRQSVAGRAWMDHEWSSAYIPEGADGWDWVGLNLDDGGAIMAFRMRRTDGGKLWASATLRSPDGSAEHLSLEAVEFEPLRSWKSPRTGIEYPVEWRLSLGTRRFTLRPLMDDQELESRRSTGTIYWEGAMRLLENGREIGRGYLEMTGYGERIQVG